MTVVRDQDGGTDIQVFADVVKVDADEFQIDANQGWSRADWQQHRYHSLATASPACPEVLTGLFDNPPGAKYVGEGDEQRLLMGDITPGTSPEAYVALFSSPLERSVMVATWVVPGSGEVDDA